MKESITQQNYLPFLTPSAASDHFSPVVGQPELVKSNRLLIVTELSVSDWIQCKYSSCFMFACFILPNVLKWVEMIETTFYCKCCKIEAFVIRDLKWMWDRRVKWGAQWPLGPPHQSIILEKKAFPACWHSSKKLTDSNEMPYIHNVHVPCTDQPLSQSLETWRVTNSTELEP